MLTNSSAWLVLLLKDSDELSTMALVYIMWDKEFKTSLANMVKPPSLLKIQKIIWAWWHVPVIPAIQEAEAGELPEPGR